MNETRIVDAIPTPDWEETLIIRVQEWGAKYPLAGRSAQILSQFGEHALGWLLLSLLGIFSSKSTGKREVWYELAISTFGAHALSVVIKRLVRRPRPHHPHIQASPTAGKYSFPSSHSSAAAAGALTLTRNQIGLGKVNLPVILLLMIHARLHKGVHYLTDLGAGAVLGSIMHMSVARFLRRRDIAKSATFDSGITGNR